MLRMRKEKPVVPQADKHYRSGARAPSRGGSRAFGYLFVAISNPTLTQIVWRHLDAHAIAYQDTDAVLTHLPGNGSQDYMLGIIELNFEKRVGLFVDYCALRRNKIISCQ